MQNNQKIPEGWSFKKLGECFKLSSGEAKPKDTDSKGKYPVFGGNGILGFSENYNFSDDNIIIGRVGEYCGCIHRFNGKCWITDNALYIKDKLLKYSNDFMFYLLINDNLSKLRNKGGQPLISQQPIYLEKILLPPLAEQEKIAGILGTWGEAIEKLSSLIEQKKNLKKGLMQKLLTGKTRLNGFTQPWKEVKLGEIGTTYTGLSGKNKDDFGKGSYFIPYMNIYQNNKIDSNQLELVDVLENESQNSVQYGDIFFTTSSETPEEVGFASVLLFKPKEPIYLNSFCFGYRLNNFNTLLPNFAVYLFRSSQIRKTMFKLAQGATRFNLSKNTLIKEKVYLPSDINEQKAIADVLSTADEEIDILNKKLEALKEQKKGLMQQLLTGQTRVKVN